MTATILEGRPIARELRAQLGREVEALRRRGKIARLVGVLAAADPAAESFARTQRKACEATGIDYRLVPLEDPSPADLERTVEELAADPGVTGIVLHRPLPPGLDGEGVSSLIPPAKDVEGMHPANLGRLLVGSGRLPPCTAMAAVKLLEASGAPVEGREAVVVGHSAIVGKPIALWLLDRLATTTVCHVATRDLAFHTRRAEILFVAVGKPGLVTGEMVRPGAVVVDIGINRVAGVSPSGGRIVRTVGDVDAESVARVAGFLTPVPGGVGPVTVAMLLRNTVRAAGGRV